MTSKKVQNFTFAYSFDDENFQEPQMTREDAILEASDYASAGERFWTGRVVERNVADVTPDGGAILEGMQIRVSDWIGEFGENWLSDVSAECVADLGRFVQDAILLWAEKWKLDHRFCEIDEVQEHFAP